MTQVVSDRGGVRYLQFVDIEQDVIIAIASDKACY
jgi:hypothetical protein